MGGSVGIFSLDHLKTQSQSLVSESHDSAENLELAERRSAPRFTSPGKSCVPVAETPLHLPLKNHTSTHPVRGGRIVRSVSEGL